ncbi:hypothetical protein HS048_26260 [Planomonospora sp. ID91781]|uniref:WD40 repeat domain-containing protein n=1 Tax=Planomonospora sp. ID91781 TaxID=2738135 RepID=UPI0018C43CBD|nr:WD40 repeat domain-containing protein [Planomonospora sp. ID91781]MBG0824216.1 hypothetical protein [Planomonospora sp. ID91781]
MIPRAGVTATGLLVLSLVLAGACGDGGGRADGRVSPGGRDSSEIVTPAPAAPAAQRLETSLASPMATSPPLPATGPPRFIVIAREPRARGAEHVKELVYTPTRPTVHDAATGRFIAAVPLPPGVLSSWDLLAAAPDNRTFVLSGWTGPEDPIRFFRITLDQDGRPGEPVPVPGFEGDQGSGYAVALSPDATRLAYGDLGDSEGGTVSVVDLATGLRRDWRVRRPLAVHGLSWAPDGRRIALTVSRWGVGVLDLGASGADLPAAARLVAPDDLMPQPLGAVAFTPDGGALVYTEGDAVKRVPADGGEAPRRLASVGLAGTSQIMRFSLDGTGRHLLSIDRWRSFRVDLTDGSATSLPIISDQLLSEGDLDAAW